MAFRDMLIRQAVSPPTRIASDQLGTPVVDFTQYSRNTLSLWFTGCAVVGIALKQGEPMGSAMRPPRSDLTAAHALA